MPLDEIVERIVFDLFGEVIFGVICYFIGMALLRCVTFAQYPPKRDEPHSKGFVVVVGVLVLASMIVATILFLKNYM